MGKGSEVKIEARLLGLTNTSKFPNPLLFVAFAAPRYSRRRGRGKVATRGFNT